MLVNIDDTLKQLFDSEKYIKEVDYRIQKKHSWLEFDVQDLPVDMIKELISDFMNSAVRLKIEGYVQEKLGVKSFVKYTNIGEPTGIRSLNSKNIGRLVNIKGVVVSVTQPQSIVTMLRYICNSCKEENYHEQFSDILEMPTRCPSCEASPKHLKVLPSKTEWNDYQVVNIQEDPESVEMGITPRTIATRTIGKHLVDVCIPGDTINVIGLMSVKQRRKDRVFSWYIQANNIDVDSFNVFNTELTDLDIMRIHNWASRPDIEQILMESLFPSIFGHEHEKYGIALAMFGGVEKKNVDVDYRGSIGVLLIGDPSTAKTAMIRAAARLAPKGIYTQAGGASGVGLTAAAVKEDDQWVLAAGSVVLANGGICCIDELEKMNKTDQDKILECMASQTVTVHKANIHATLPAKTAILSAANPKYGRYKDEMTPADNIELPPPLLARFDLIFIIKDIPEKEKDTAIVDKIFGAYTNEKTSDLPHMDADGIKKYIIYAKRIIPVLTPSARKMLKDYYVKVRNNETREDHVIPITVRQFQGLIRLSTAVARMNLESTVTDEHAQKAIDVFMDALRKAGIDPLTGKMDSLVNETGKGQSSYQTNVKFLEALGDKPITVKEAFRLTGGFVKNDRIKWDEKIRKLTDEGKLYHPQPGVTMAKPPD